MLNPFMPIGISHHYHLDESISNLRVFGSNLHFYINFISALCKHTEQNLIRRRILRRLIWFCSVCPCPINRMIGLYGLSRKKLLKILFDNSLSFAVVEI